MTILDVLLSWLSFALCIWLAALLPGFEVKQGFKGAAVAATVLWVLYRAAMWLVFDLLNLDAVWHMGDVVKALVRWALMALLIIVTAKATKAAEVQNFALAFLAAVVITVSGRFVVPFLSSFLALRI